MNETPIEDSDSVNQIDDETQMIEDAGYSMRLCMSQRQECDGSYGIEFRMHGRKPRPYITVSLGRIMYQFGWLWDIQP